MKSGYVICQLLYVTMHSVSIFSPSAEILLALYLPLKHMKCFHTALWLEWSLIRISSNSDVTFCWYILSDLLFSLDHPKDISIRRLLRTSMPDNQCVWVCLHQELCGYIGSNAVGVSCQQTACRDGYVTNCRLDIRLHFASIIQFIRYDNLPVWQRLAEAFPVQLSGLWMEQGLAPVGRNCATRSVMALMFFVQLQARSEHYT